MPIANPEPRIEAAREVHDVENLSFVETAITQRSFLEDLLAVHNPDTILHTAARPLAPYSQINGEPVNYTQQTNLRATRNLLWVSKTTNRQTTTS